MCEFLQPYKSEIKNFSAFASKKKYSYYSNIANPYALIECLFLLLFVLTTYHNHACLTYKIINVPTSGSKLPR